MRRNTWFENYARSSCRNKTWPALFSIGPRLLEVWQSPNDGEKGSSLSKRLWCSAPGCRIRTLALVVQTTCDFSVAIDPYVPTFHTTASSRLSPPVCRMPLRP